MQEKCNFIIVCKILHGLLEQSTILITYMQLSKDYIYVCAMFYRRSLLS